MVKSKKGYMKTLEAIIAIIILISFLLALLPEKEPQPKIPQDIRLLQTTIMNNIQNDEFSRQCILNDLPCVNDSISSIFPSTLKYTFTICDINIDNCVATGLPDKSVYVSDLVVSSTLSNPNTRLFRLYIWRKA